MPISSLNKVDIFVKLSVWILCLKASLVLLCHRNSLLGLKIDRITKNINCVVNFNVLVPILKNQFYEVLGGFCLLMNEFRISFYGSSYMRWLIFSIIIDIECKFMCHVIIFQGHEDEVFVLEAHPTDSRVFLSSGHDGRIILWDLVSGSIVKNHFNLVISQFNNIFYWLNTPSVCVFIIF